MGEIEEVSEAQAEKSHEIIFACEKKNIDQLRRLATLPGGLLNDRCRSIAWPLLLGSSEDAEDDKRSWQNLERHRDEEQVQLDVDRSFVYYPRDVSEAERRARKQELSQVIVAVLRRHPMLHYFQGYHDIVQVMLLALGHSRTVSAAARLSLLRIRDYMLPTMTATEFHLHLLPVILFAADPEVCAHLSGVEPFFALAATLTLYAHDIEDYGDISRLFDFLLASEAVMSLYLFAVVAVSRKKELLEIPSDEPEMLHFTLSKLPKPLNLDDLVQRASNLFQSHPPETLPGRTWVRIPADSVLKSTRDFSALQKQTILDGEKMFLREEIEIRRREAVRDRQRRLKVLAWRYRAPAAFTGTAVLVALIAVYFQRTGLALPLVGLKQGWLGFSPLLKDLWLRVTALSA